MNRIFLTLCLLPQLAVATPPANITLLEKGEAPHRALKLEPPKGLSTTLRIEVMQSVTQQTGDRLDVTKMPRIQFDGELELKASKGPYLTYTITFTTVRVIKTKDMEKGTDRALKAKWKQLLGMTYNAKVTVHGHLVDAKLTLPTRPHPAIKTPLQSFQQTLREMHIPIPAKPVGVGARWQIESIVTVNGVAMKRIQTWSLKRMGRSMVLIGQSEESANPKSVELGELPEGMRAEVQKVGGSASNTVRLSRRHLLPSSWKQEAKHHLNLKGQIGESQFETNTVVESKMRLTLNPKK